MSEEHTDPAGIRRPGLVWPAVETLKRIAERLGLEIHVVLGVVKPSQGARASAVEVSTYHVAPPRTADPANDSSEDSSED